MTANGGRADSELSALCVIEAGGRRTAEVLAPKSAEPAIPLPCSPPVYPMHVRRQHGQPGVDPLIGHGHEATVDKRSGRRCYMCLLPTAIVVRLACAAPQSKRLQQNRQAISVALRPRTGRTNQLASKRREWGIAGAKRQAVQIGLGGGGEYEKGLAARACRRNVGVHADSRHEVVKRVALHEDGPCRVPRQAR